MCDKCKFAVAYDYSRVLHIAAMSTFYFGHHCLDEKLHTEELITKTTAFLLMLSAPMYMVTQKENNLQYRY
jgi:hypothetical protein